MQITWTNCTAAMPPDDATEVIIKTEQGHMYVDTGNWLHYLLSISSDTCDLAWTPYTAEKWKELNK